MGGASGGGLTASPVASAEVAGGVGCAPPAPGPAAAPPKTNPPGETTWESGLTAPSPTVWLPRDSSPPTAGIAAVGSRAAAFSSLRGGAAEGASRGRTSSFFNCENGVSGRLAPHDMQKAASSLFSVPHEGHSISGRPFLLLSVFRLFFILIPAAAFVNQRVLRRGASIMSQYLHRMVIPTHRNILHPTG